MSRVHKGVKALQSAAPWYYKPLVYFYRLAKFPMRVWRKYRRDLGPVLAIQAGKWNQKRVVSRMYNEQQGLVPGRVVDNDDAFVKWGRLQKGWLYDTRPGASPQRSYVRPANAPRSQEWKPDTPTST